MDYENILFRMWRTVISSNCFLWIPAVLSCFMYMFLTQAKTTRDMFGKVVFITGASSGLGEQLARVFYSQGCKVILAARRLNELERVKSELLALKMKTTTFTPVIIQLDLSDLKSLPKKAQEVLAICGQIDILINNAGVSYRGHISSTSIDVDLQIMMINYFGQIALTKALLPSMMEKKQGHIVVISSVQGKIAIPYRSAYGASKHALQAFFDCLRAEVSQYGISVTVVNPGYICTDLSCNAITGSGERYGDRTTANGLNPLSVAEDIYMAVAREKQEVTIATLSPRIAMFLRHIYPSFFFYLMKRRAKIEALKNS